MFICFIVLNPKYKIMSEFLYIITVVNELYHVQILVQGLYELV